MSVPEHPSSTPPAASSRPRVHYYVAQSLDGFIADEHGGLEWLLRYDGVEGVAESYQSFLEGVGALVMGAKTYDFVTSRPEEPWPYPGLPTWVFTHRPRAVPEGADVRFVSGDVRDVAASLGASAGERDVWLVGGGALVAEFARIGWLDELHVCVTPVVLGRGAPLLPMRADLELTRVTRFGAGLVELRYSFAPPSPLGAVRTPTPRAPAP